MEEATAGQLSVTEIGALSWQHFQTYVADLCQRDGNLAPHLTHPP
ncbi:hypothetical protein [Streptomyces sp. NPDC056721]